MNQRNTLFPIALITFLLLSSCGNSGIVRGTIHDSITKQTIDGVFVQMIGSETSTYTDGNGCFLMENAGLSPAIVVVSKTGYNTENIVIENEENTNIYLEKSQRQQIIGKWKLNRTEFIHGVTDTPGDGNTFEFFENGDYTRFIWGFESGGTFQLAENELRLNENYRIGDREGSERGEYLLHIQIFEEDSLIISFTECDALVFQTYLPVD